MNGRSYSLATAPLVLPCPDAPALPLHYQRAALRLVLVASDVLALGLAFSAGYWIRFDLGVTVSPEVVPAPGYYLRLLAMVLPLFVGALALCRAYDVHELLGGVVEYSRVFNACSAAAMVVVAGSFFSSHAVVSRLWLSAAWLMSFLTVVLGRFACRRLAYALRGKGYLLTPAIIVGTNQEATTLARDLKDWRSSGLRILGFLTTTDEEPVSNLETRPILGSVGEVRNVVASHGVEDIVVSITAVSRQKLLALSEEVASLRGVYLRLSSGLYEILTTGMKVRTLGSVPLVSLNKARLEPSQLWAKTVLEYSVVIPAVVILAPVFALIAVLVRIDSKGPIIHRRRVLGESGIGFDAYKFRTMDENADTLLESRPDLNAELQTNHKLKVDPRVTRIGRWLRRYSLDELPQLFNVLRGQMSLVGPRMITQNEAEKYGRHKLNLLTVRPGITGLWQVSGRSDLSYEERVQLDMYYIRNYSVWLDLQILVQTLPAVIRGHGAY